MCLWRALLPTQSPTPVLGNVYQFKSSVFHKELLMKLTCDGVQYTHSDTNHHPLPCYIPFRVRDPPLCRREPQFHDHTKKQNSKTCTILRIYSFDSPEPAVLFTVLVTCLLSASEVVAFCEKRKKIRDAQRRVRKKNILLFITSAPFRAPSSCSYPQCILLTASLQMLRLAVYLTGFPSAGSHTLR